MSLNARNPGGVGAQIAYWQQTQKTTLELAKGPGTALTLVTGPAVILVSSTVIPAAHGLLGNKFAQYRPLPVARHLD